MLNLNPKDVVQYTPAQQQAIDVLLANRGNKKGGELWKEKGVDDIFVNIQKRIRKHSLVIQRVKCVYCETALEFGGAHIEHFAPKGKHPEFLYEPLNLSCSCPNCNGVAKKGDRETIDGQFEKNYTRNRFKYVHPYLDDVDKEIRYRDPFKLFYNREKCSEKGLRTIDMFHWDTIHARRKRFMNLLDRSTDKKRRKMIAEILGYKG